MNYVKKIFISFGLAFLVVCFGLVLISNWNIMGWKAMKVPTGSMNPAIPPGSLVLMHSVPNSSLKVGDVITYTSPQNMKTTISHRIIKAYSINGLVPAYITKGDANPTADPNVVVGGQVRGKIVGHVPHIGTWLTWGKGWPSIILLVYLPALWIMIEQVILLSRYYGRVKLYRVPDFKPAKAKLHVTKFAASVALAAGLVTAALVVAPSVHALLSSNTVALTPNRLSVAARPKPPHCSNTININNSSNQTAGSGSANGGNATSGNASNTNSTNVNINVNGCYQAP